MCLNKANEECRTKLMFLWWRSWHLRNDIISSKGDASVTASAHFLFNYANALLSLNGRPPLHDPKGKSLLGAGPRSPEWRPPDTGWAKLNVDASLVPSSGAAAWGGILRDESGAVIASNWNLIPNCQSAEFAEGIACLKGIRLARRFSNLPLNVESDCQSLVLALTDPSIQRSSLRPVIEEIRHLCVSV
ncbi:hypothetical protein BRADI_5g07048v3 [Brachypodium distachyon]|uniref:RNase H type-1 domain-containing protein n=1 Tax=Brachypodium distachyon TaxID=15368 RepID=A0A0Q3H253_BRADI|nr:hypothetical protein BRADI_5g07048v3 [Brachypodium distachyon]